MVPASPDGSPNASPLDVERVEWTPVSAEVLEVRVVGRWRTKVPKTIPALIVDDGNAPRPRFEAQAGAGADADGLWSATYTVPIELRSKLNAILLKYASREIALPTALPGGGAGAPPPARVVDPTVLDAHRARRTELADESLLRRAQIAEATLETLETQLGHLEERLDEAGAERDDLAAALKAAEQREEAERRVRVEAEDSRAVLRGELSGEAAELRVRLAAAEDHAERLAAEMDEIRREGAEAQHAAEGARRAALHAEAAATRRELAAAQSLAEAGDRVVRVEETARELERLAEGATALGELLSGERSARTDAEAALQAERDHVAEATATITLLEHELDRRATVQSSVLVELEELREALVRVRAQSEQQAGVQDEAQGRLAELQDTAASMRARVTELESRERAVTGELREARAELDRRARELARAKADLDRAVRDAGAAQAAEAGHTAALREAERTIMAVRSEAGEAQRALDEERRRRFEVEASLKSQLERERETVSGQIAEIEGQLKVQIATERHSFEQQVQGFETTVVELRARLSQAATELEARLAAERRERQLAEEARDDAELAREAAEAAVEQARAEAARAAREADLDATEARTQVQRVARDRDAFRVTATTAVRTAREAAAASAAQLQRAAQEQHAAHAEELAELREAGEDALAAARSAHEQSLRAVLESHADDLRDAHAALEAASAESARLEAELSDRDAVSERLRLELRGLAEQLDEVRREAVERVEREAAVEALVAEVLETATLLREGFQTQMRELERDTAARAETERLGFRVELAGVQDRIAALRAELEDERTARWVAEEELAAERERELRPAAPRVAADPATAEELVHTRRELARAQEELAAERARGGESDALQSQARAMVRDLEDAEARLKAEREALEARAAQAEAEDEIELAVLLDVPEEPAVEPESVVEIDPAVEPEGAVEPEPAVESPRRRGAARGDDPFGLTSPEDEDEPESDPLELLSRQLVEDDERNLVADDELLEAQPQPRPEQRPEPRQPERRVIAPEQRRPVGWLAPAIEVLAHEDEPAAAALVAELLSAQGPGIADDIVYAVTIEGFATYRVDVNAGRGRVESRGDAGAIDDVEVHIAGPAPALAPLAAGGAGRRLRGARVEGSKRRLRRILKARRAPVTLDALVAQGVTVSPGLLLCALTIAVDPAWTAGHHFTIAYDIDGAHEPGPWVAVRDGQPVEVLRAAPAGEAITATVVVGAAAFLTLLARLAPPPGERVDVTGDVRAVELLGAWFDRAQGLPDR